LNAPTVSIRIAEESTPDHIEGPSRTRGSIFSRVKHLDLTDIHTLLDEIITRRTDVGYHQKQVRMDPAGLSALALRKWIEQPDPGGVN
jgi:hypothetical protein